MKITILSVGTRGDVQPYIALGLGFRAAGHDVQIAAPSNFEEFVRGYGLGYARLEANFRELMETSSAQELMTSRNPWRSYRETRKLIQYVLESFAADSWKACQNCDALVFSSIAVTGYSVAEKLGLPSCWAPLQPMSRTRAFPGVVSPIRGNRNGTLNWLTHILEEQATWQPSRNFINHWRRDTLGLKPYPFSGPYSLLEKKHFPIIYGYSPTILPKPSDWGDWIHIAGYWFLDRPAEWLPPAGLVDFIQAGKPPIYVGFGSMNSYEAKELTQTVIDAVTLAKVRAVFATGWGSLAEVTLPDTIYSVDTIPHDWLFPQMAAAVHHGGAGTTAAAMRAGIPSIVVPHILDQVFWGQRVFDLGIGTQPIQRKQITAENLAAAIRTVISDKEMRQRAIVLGKQLNAEDGISRGVELILHYILS